MRHALAYAKPPSDTNDLFDNDKIAVHFYN